MAPKVEPIMLWGFCFTTQAEQRFNQSWACAFHTSWYTDEQHPMWEAVDDPAKRREIRYGNNICLLFRALLHCRRFYGQDNLWQAIARGFNTSSSVVRATADILTDARRAQRAKPSKDVSDTAVAADDWIHFLDTRPPHPRGPPDPEVHKVADAFFKDQGKRLLNAARVPVNGRPAFRAHARGAVDDVGLSPRLAPSSPMKVESPREPAADRNRPPPFTHKRSASPPRDDRSPKLRRFESDTRPPPRNEPDRHGALDELPMIQPTRSPPRPSHTGTAQAARAAQPAPLPSPQVKREEAVSRPPPTVPSVQPAKSVVQPATGGTSTAASAPQPQLEANAAQPKPPPSGPTRSEAAPKPPPVLERREGGSSISLRAVPDDRSALQARVASLERQLTETKSKLSSSPTATTPTAPSIPIQLVQEMAGLKRDMASATNAIGTMMESMHDIVDSLNSLQDEVSALATQQKDHLSSPPPAPAQQQPNPPNLDALLAPLQTLTSTVTTLRADLATLKATTTTTPPTPSPSSNSTLESLLQAQSARMDKLAHQLANVQTTQAQLLARPHGQGAAQGQPQTLRQAMAAAERDLRHHLGTVQQFYHHSASGGGVGVSRAVTERTADFLATLSEGVRVAQAGAGGGL